MMPCRCVGVTPSHPKAERRGKTVNKNCNMSHRDGLNDPPFFAFDRDSATDILKSAGSDAPAKKGAMEVSMPFRSVHAGQPRTIDTLRGIMFCRAKMPFPDISPRTGLSRRLLASPKGCLS